MRRAILPAVLAALCAAPAMAGDDIRFAAAPGDPAAASVEAMVPAAKARIEGFFSQPFGEPLHVTLASDRAAFNAAFPAAWGMSQTECWMVGVGVADFLVLLSPADWAKEACEHDAADAGEAREILTHELVHMYHGQHNPTRDFTGADDIGWFVEGLAVLASGQLDAKRQAEAAQAIRDGAAPKSLATAWSGPHRYAVAGSLVQYVDETYGRATVVALLPAVTQADVLGKLGVTEPELLDRWKAWALKRAS